jgi:hypothetical protein
VPLEKRCFADTAVTNHNKLDVECFSWLAIKKWAETFGALGIHKVWSRTIISEMKPIKESSAWISKLLGLDLHYCFSTYIPISIVITSPIMHMLVMPWIMNMNMMMMTRTIPVCDCVCH